MQIEHTQPGISLYVTVSSQDIVTESSIDQSQVHQLEETKKAPAKAVQPWESLIFDEDEEEFSGPNKLDFISKTMLDGVQSIYMIDPAGVKEISAVKKPVEVCTKVFGALLAAFGEKYGSWDSVRALLRSKTLLKDCLNYDKANIEFKTCKKIHEHLKEVESSKVKAASYATLEFYLWLKGIVYFGIYRGLSGEDPSSLIKSPSEGSNSPSPNKEETKSPPCTSPEATPSSSWEDLIFDDDQEEFATADKEEFVMKILSAAAESISKINRQQITELKSFSKPPATVKTVLSGLVIAFGIRNLSWENKK